MTIAYLLVRSPFVHPMLLENLASASVMNSLELSVGVSSYLKKKTYDLIFDPVSFAPRTHHPRIVECNNDHQIDALCLDFRQMIDESWQVPYRTARGEGAYHEIIVSRASLGSYTIYSMEATANIRLEALQARKSHTRNGKEDDFLIRKFFASVVLLRHTAGGDGLFLRSIRDIPTVSSLNDRFSLRELLLRETHMNFTPLGKLSPALTGFGGASSGEVVDILMPDQLAEDI